MTTELRKYTEPLQDNEFAFLVSKEKNRRKGYYSMYHKLMIGCFFLPFFGTWYSAASGAVDAFSYTRYFLVTGVLLVICAIATYLLYRYNVRNILQDIKYKMKTIATHAIISKRFIVQNDSYFFYISSKPLLYIEVSQYDFFKRKQGDEVTIEYATYSKEFLGYF